MSQPSPLEHLQGLPSYFVSHIACEADDVIRLSFNEGAFGASPLALAAYQQAAGQLHRYPDLNYTELRQSIAAHYQLDPERVVCGAGSDDLLNLLARGYARAGDEIIHSQYGFSMYGIITKQIGAVPVVVPEKNFSLDIDAVLNAVTPKTRLIFIANPNNPTGTYLPQSEILRLHKNLPRNILLVLDAAYAEYMTQPDYSDGLELAATTPNVVVTHTFSKMHALGGLRVGWAYGSADVVATLNRIRNPFNVTAASVAAAIASLSDHTFQQHNREHNAEWREWLATTLRQMNNLQPYPSVTNFLLLGAGTAERAQRLLSYLAAARIQLRSMAGYQLPAYLRVSIGREDEMRTLAEVLKKFPD
jgi:histidinol-phosphate aminotransferase